MGGSYCRSINSKERAALFRLWLDLHCAGDEETMDDVEEVNQRMESANFAIIDGYQTDCPGYQGRVLFVLYDGSPNQYQSYTWDRDRERWEPNPAWNHSEVGEK